MAISERKQEILNSCLDLFVLNGLSNTSTRELSSAMNLQSSGMYYYFNSKDELVIACAEEAALKIEKALVSTAENELSDPKNMMDLLQKKALELSPIMRFFVSVCME